MIVLGLFAVTLFLIGVALPHVPAWLMALSLIGPAYYLGMSAYLHFTRLKGSR